MYNHKDNILNINNFLSEKNYQMFVVKIQMMANI